MNQPVFKRKCSVTVVRVTVYKIETFSVSKAEAYNEAEAKALQGEGVEVHDSATAVDAEIHKEGYIEIKP